MVDNAKKFDAPKDDTPTVDSSKSELPKGETVTHRIWSLSPLPLRFILGFGFLFHGYPKLFTAQGNQTFVGMLEGIGVPAPGLTAYLVGGFEFFGGILLILGVAVRLIALLGGIQMVAAALTVHMSAGFNFMNVRGMAEDGSLQFGMPGFEVNLLYLAGFLSLLLTGAGRASLPRVSRTKGSRGASEPSP